jgi:three-Cys-motif partner protein
MTSSKVVQGQSRDTEWKERGILSAIAINFQIATAKLPWAPYFHFDLHAGCGWNHEFGVMGSPLAFWNVAETSGHARPIGHFVELDAGRAAELRARPEIKGRRDCFVHHEDNADFCSLIPDIIRAAGDKPQYAIGSILIDPNGPIAVPYDAIAEVLRQCPRLDVIYNFPGTGTKRLPDGHRQKITINDIPALFSKEHWLIRKQVGPWQWSLMIGRNLKTRDYPSLGFYHWESDRGQGVVLTLATTERERAKAQMRLF